MDADLPPCPSQAVDSEDLAAGQETARSWIVPSSASLCVAFDRHQFQSPWLFRMSPLLHTLYHSLVIWGLEPSSGCIPIPSSTKHLMCPSYLMSSLPLLLFQTCSKRIANGAVLKLQIFRSKHWTLLVLAKYTCQMSAANYQLSNKQKLMLLMLIDGNNWRGPQASDSFSIQQDLGICVQQSLWMLGTCWLLWRACFIDSATMLDMAED